ncbi:hypothetical protein SB444474_5375 [Shigella boydii 4444-74]|uniref:Uncharacterized protein n=1 Tax=Shigella boydii 4444-74 TaxID=766140 RepID=I6F8P3_SHIBO|nr:hypothetical protein SB444474_5375 [Shigella boydii 4444-74]
MTPAIIRAVEYLSRYRYHTDVLSVTVNHDLIQQHRICR